MIPDSIYPKFQGETVKPFCMLSKLRSRPCISRLPHKASYSNTPKVFGNVNGLEHLLSIPTFSKTSRFSTPPSREWDVAAAKAWGAWRCAERGGVTTGWLGYLNIVRKPLYGSYGIWKCRVYLYGWYLNHDWQWLAINVGNLIEIALSQLIAQISRLNQPRMWESSL